MATKVITKCMAIELEHPETGKILFANCACCASARPIEEGLFSDIPVKYICHHSNCPKEAKSRILTELNYCCSKFTLSKDFASLGYRVVGKYNAKNSKIKKL